AEVAQRGEGALGVGRILDQYALGELQFQRGARQLELVQQAAHGAGEVVAQELAIGNVDGDTDRSAAVVDPLPYLPAGLAQHPAADAHDVAGDLGVGDEVVRAHLDRKSTRLNSSHVKISYAVFCLKKK